MGKGLVATADITGSIQLGGGGGRATYAQMKAQEAMQQVIQMQCESGETLEEYAKDQKQATSDYWSGVWDSLKKNIITEQFVTFYGMAELLTQWNLDDTEALKKQLDEAEAFKINIQIVDREEYYRGRVEGDVASLVLSGLGMFGGITAAGSGAAATAGTAGIGGIVGIPVAIAGVALAGYSAAAGAASIKNMASDVDKFREALRKSQEAKSGNHGDFGNYEFKEGIDEDLRGGKATLEEALEMAFEKTGVPKKEFKVTQWGKDKYGKSHPVEWRGPKNAEVNIDFGHDPNRYSPAVDHIGWKTGGKSKKGEKITGHIFIDEVPYGRPQK